MNILTWNSQYSVYTAKIGFMNLSCAWKSGGYEVVVSGFRLKELEPDLDKAQAKAIKLCRTLVHEVQKELDTLI